MCLSCARSDRQNYDNLDLHDTGWSNRALYCSRRTCNNFAAFCDNYRAMLLITVIPSLQKILHLEQMAQSMVNETKISDQKNQQKNLNSLTLFIRIFL